MTRRKKRALRNRLVIQSTASHRSDEGILFENIILKINSKTKGFPHCPCNWHQTSSVHRQGEREHRQTSKQGSMCEILLRHCPNCKILVTSKQQTCKKVHDCHIADGYRTCGKLNAEIGPPKLCTTCPQDSECTAQPRKKTLSGLVSRISRRIMAERVAFKAMAKKVISRGPTMLKKSDEPQMPIAQRVIQPLRSEVTINTTTSGDTMPTQHGNDLGGLRAPATHLIHRPLESNVTNISAANLGTIRSHRDDRLGRPRAPKPQIVHQPFRADFAQPLRTEATKNCSGPHLPPLFSERQQQHNALGRSGATNTQYSAELPSVEATSSCQAPQLPPFLSQDQLGDSRRRTPVYFSTRPLIEPTPLKPMVSPIPGFYITHRHLSGNSESDVSMPPEIPWRSGISPLSTSPQAISSETLSQRSHSPHHGLSTWIEPG